jgi:hypothetical protein
MISAVIAALAEIVIPALLALVASSLDSGCLAGVAPGCLVDDLALAFRLGWATLLASAFGIQAFAVITMLAAGSIFEKKLAYGRSQRLRGQGRLRLRSHDAAEPRRVALERIHIEFCDPSRVADHDLVNLLLLPANEHRSLDSHAGLDSFQLIELVARSSRKNSVFIIQEYGLVGKRLQVKIAICELKDRVLTMTRETVNLLEVHELVNDNVNSARDRATAQVVG